MDILIVEDDRMLLKALSNDLTNAGYTVHTAENGNVAANIILDYKVDLIICDLMMPVLDGATFLSLLKNYFSSSVPVIVMSTLDYADRILKNNNIRFTTFIQKPFKIDDLLKIVNQFKPIDR